VCCYYLARFAKVNKFFSITFRDFIGAWWTMHGVLAHLATGSDLATLAFLAACLATLPDDNLIHIHFLSHQFVHNSTAFNVKDYDWNSDQKMSKRENSQF
jgi:hypothetical protein